MIKIPVQEIMRSPVRTIGRYTTAAEAARELYVHEIGSLVVVDEHGTPIGIITKSDINLVVAEGLIPSDTSAEAIMSSPVVTVGATESLRTAAGLMQEHSIKKLPVVSETGELVGVIATVDLAYYLPAYAKKIHSRTPRRTST